jgi:hypothetical protein
MSFPADVPLYLRHYFSRPNTGTAEHCLFFLVNTGGIFMTGRLEEPSETIGTERWRSISDQRKLGPPAVDYLVSNLRDSDKKVRMARGPLNEACRDRNGFVRAVAQEMLEKLNAGQSS